MRYYIIATLCIFSGLAYLGCGGANSGGTTSVGALATSNLSGPCEDINPIAWAVRVVDDGRGNQECPDSTAGVEVMNILGPVDGMFASLGVDSGGYVIVELDTAVVDGPDCDLVVYEIANGDSNVAYNVYLSDSPDMGFVLVAGVFMEGVYCVDLAGSGITRGQYVKLEQMAATGGGEVCADSAGADIDAVGVLNTDSCPDVDDACEYVGAKVDEICPPDGDYRNHGDYVSCVAHAATDVIKGMAWQECFSEDDLDYIHGCVVSQRARTDIGKKKP